MKLTLIDGVQMNAAHPTTFQIPSDADKAALMPGDYVKLGFTDGRNTERMWVIVTAPGAGILDNDPAYLPLECGAPVSYEPRHILSIEPGERGNAPLH